MASDATIGFTREESLGALVIANNTRTQRAQVRRDLRSGNLTLTQIMTEPPASLETLLLIDVLRMVRTRDQRGHVWLTRLGRKALSENVNLMLPVGKASARTRAWVAEHGMAGVHAPALRAKGLV